MVWNASVVLIAALATLAALRESVRRALLQEMDQILFADMEEIRLALEGSSIDQLHDQLNRKAQAHTLQGWYARVLSDRGEVLFSTSNAPSPPLVAAWRDGRSISVGGYRLLQIRLTTTEGSALTVRVGSTLGWIQADLEHIDRNCLLLGAIVLVVAPLTGFWLAGRATRPMQDIVDTVRRLRPSNLHERLSIRGTNDELDQISTSFNRLLDRLGAYLEQKRDSLANAAHELRTPLAAIRSTAEVAIGGDRSREEYDDLLTSVVEECSLLETLVNQLLLLAETEASPIRNYGEVVRFDSLVKKTQEMFEAVAEDKGVRLAVHIPEPIRVEGNSHHLRQVLNNLIDNAIKFTPEHGRIVIELSQQHQQALLLVRDTGVGIAREELPKVFERFFRSDRSRPRKGEMRGTGLGLSICQAIIQAHGGDISIQSEPGVGTTVAVTLPIVSDTADTSG